MTRYRHPRVDLLRGSRSIARPRTPRRTTPPAERLLSGLGAHPSFADALLGDLAEEHARLAEERGALAARWWYLREAMRAAPHLLMNALRHGGARGRARAAAVMLGIALVPTVALLALALRDGPPARLVAGAGGSNGGADGIVINSRRPVKLAMRALDIDGHVLRSADVQYRWVSGAPMHVASNGVVSCRRSGDATVRASIGSVATSVLVRCRPVTLVFVDGNINLVVGGPARELSFAAFGPDGRAVTEVAGEIRVDDTTIVKLTGTRIRAVAPGWTRVTVRIGDREGSAGIGVYELVPTFERLRPGQLRAIVPVRVRPGETIRQALPTGLFWLEYDGPGFPILAVEGPVICMPDFTPTNQESHCLVRGPGASVRITHPGPIANDLSGTLALWREPDADKPVPPPRSKP